MADDGSQQRKLDFRTAVEEVEVFARGLTMELESVLGRRMARRVLWTSAIVAVLTISILIGYSFGITLWAWVKLLVVPAVLAAGGVWFNQQQQNRQQETQDQRSQDEALQAYLDQLTQLLVTQGDKRLTRRRVDDDVRQVIQARSEPLLRNLNPTRRFSLILFLAVMGLLTKGSPIFSLAGADLRSVDGRGAPLQGVDLREANLRGANLSGADLSEADLSGADLREAYLSEAYLSGAYLEATYLERADLRGADLSRAYLERANLRDAYLVNTRLEGANLSGADLREAYLSEANLSRAYLEGAYLSRADLSGAAGVTTTELEQQTPFLGGAIMPDGSKHL